MGLLDDLGQKAKEVGQKAKEVNEKINPVGAAMTKDAVEFMKDKTKDFKDKKEEKEKIQSEAEKNLEIELDKAKNVIITTSDINKNYEVIDICFGFAKDRSYITQYERGLKMLKYHAFKKGCDAVIGLQIQMMEGKESTSGGSLTGALLGAVTEKVMEEMIFVDQIPKDGAILFGTGIKFK
tara:strand:- start:61 stop:603 length:543 start_codon:yes stop_codon:yes gene_type:complete